MRASAYQQAIVGHVRRSWAALQVRRGRGRPAPSCRLFEGEPPGEPRNLVVEATAGSGKSTCLRMVCAAVPDAQCTVVAYNARVAADFGRSLPSNARSLTLHAAGKRAWEQFWGYRFVEGSGEGVGELAKDKTMRCVRALKEAGQVDRYLRAGQVCKLVEAAKSVGLVPRAGAGLAAVCPRDPVQLQPIAEDTDEVWFRLMAKQEIECDRPGLLVAAARLTLQRCVESSDWIIDFADMVYLPALAGVPQPALDLVLVDELQDLDALQRAMVRQMCADALFVGVGDPFQCQPPGTEVQLASGFVKNIEDVRPGDRVVQYSRREGAFLGASAHNTRAVVEQVAHRPYKGRLISVAAGGRKTRCTPEHKWEVKWSDRQTKTCVVYLMQRGAKFRVGWCQLFSSQAALHLSVRARLERADCAWILHTFDDRSEASVYESVVACEFGIPTIPFEPVGGANHLTTEAIDSFFRQVDVDRIAFDARRCLDAHGRDHRFPIWRSCEEEGRVRKGRTTVFEAEACNLLDGLMQVPVYAGVKSGANWTTISLSEEAYEGEVYSLAVGGAHTYVADGIGTHNCIYAWRGADSDSMERVRVELDCDVLPLRETYRCPTSHVELARELGAPIEALPGAPEGEVEDYQGRRVTPDMFRPGDAVLCHRNAPLLRVAYWLMRARVPVRVVGRDFGRGLRTFCEQVADQQRLGRAQALLESLRRRRDALLKRSDPDDPPEAATQMAERVEVLEVVWERVLDRDPDCESLRDLLDELDRTFSDDVSDDVVTLTSVHRAKGGEWERVWWADADKCQPSARMADWRRREVRNLRFVATTRSRHFLGLFSTEDLA